LTSMDHLASTYENQGRRAEAEKLTVQAMKSANLKTALGLEHPSTMTGMNNLASIYYNQGRWAEAEELVVQVMETRKAVLGPDDPPVRTQSTLLPCDGGGRKAVMETKRQY
jgi:Flp pilus assembly protein TadD